MRSKEICELKLKDNIAFPILRSSNKNDVEKKLNLILNEKKEDLARFSMEHSLLNIGMKMTITPQKITCAFIVSSNEELNFSNEDLSDFVDIFSPEFEMEDVANRNKLLGYPKWFDLNDSDLKDKYMENVDIFEEIQDILEHHNVNYSKYNKNIEDFILNMR